MRRSGMNVPSWRACAHFALAVICGVALGACATKTDDGSQTVVEPIPGHGHAYFDLKYRPASTARPDAPDAAWNVDTVDTCYSNGVCAIQGIANTPSWGLTLRCNGDPTCDQSTFAIVPVNLRAGVHIAWDPQTVGDGQTTWSTISVDRTVAAGTLTIRYATQKTTGPGVSWTIGRINTQVLCGVAANTCPHLDVVDTFAPGSPVVSGNPAPKRSSMIGHEANFVARARGGSGSYRISTIAWNPTGWVYKPHQLDGTQPASLGYGDLHSPTLNIFWTSSGDQHVSAAASLVRADNQEISHAATNIYYSLAMPDVVAALLVHPERISVGKRADAPGLWLRWGNAARNSEAIGMRYKVTNDHGFPGMISIAQTVSGSIAYSPNVGPAFGASMTNALDGPIFYRKPVSSRAAFGPAPYDAPAVGLRNTDTGVSVNEAFSTFFLYKPNLHGDWVTVKRGAWSFTAAATLLDAPTNKWCVNGTTGCPGGAPTAVGAVGALQGSMDLPLWTTSFNPVLPVARPGAPYTSIAPHP